MVTLNDYLYSGDTMFKILKNYSRDLKAEAKQTNNEIDLIHANFLIQIRELLEPFRSARKQLTHLQKQLWSRARRLRSMDMVRSRDMIFCA